MDGGLVFSLEELQEMKKDQLEILVTYYNLAVPKKASKKDLVETLDKFYHPPVQEEAVYVDASGKEVQVSVRIRRIKEANNGS